MPRKSEPAPPPDTASLLEGISELSGPAFRTWIALCVIPIEILARGIDGVAAHMGWAPSTTRADVKELEDGGFARRGDLVDGTRAIEVVRRPMLLGRDRFVKLSAGVPIDSARARARLRSVADLLADPEKGDRDRS